MSCSLRSLTSSISSFSQILFDSNCHSFSPAVLNSFSPQRALCRSAANLAPPVAASSAAPLGRWHEQINRSASSLPFTIIWLSVCLQFRHALAFPFSSRLSPHLGHAPFTQTGQLFERSRPADI
ncbi:uncharacterized protein BO96DRAFT_214907 [Aspergillus niger CBS 101883]|uniref:uncharacterized protein n=1 Tax=Aspergillus lacticoffeatus (strain CBS 101883) TaxID=1450533 RepID=UPI000D7EE195|nr:uncharacterized protein BO96DRAFT_214907 [Aspergillus niger CBS 101883]PYH59656.1 hypothetical protein BO96DRAFT_214907 [Aspergillus niger CBS 101883]